LFDWATELTGTGDRSEFIGKKLLGYWWNQLYRDTDIEGLCAYMGLSMLLITEKDIFDVVPVFLLVKHATAYK